MDATRLLAGLRTRRALLSGATLAGAAIVSGSVGAASQRHRVVLLVDSDDEKIMRHAVGYAVNLHQHYAGKGETLAMEIVANGAGIKLFRGDTSPLQQPLTAVRGAFPTVTFSMCNSSKLIAEAREGHPVPLMAGTQLVPFGIGRLIDLQEAGWSYINA